MSEAYIQYEHESGTWARWYGGEYIELGYVATEPTGPFNDRGEASYDPGDFVAHDVINVWNHSTDKARIPFTLDALQEEVDDHLN